MSRRTLLTVSGVIPTDLDERVAAGEAPRADYAVLADRLGADLLDLAEARRSSGPLGRLIERLGGPGALLGWSCFRRPKH
jgi:hypothetical protein